MWPVDVYLAERITSSTIRPNLCDPNPTWSRRLIDRFLAKLTFCKYIRKTRYVTTQYSGFCSRNVHKYTSAKYPWPLDAAQCSLIRIRKWRIFRLTLLQILLNNLKIKPTQYLQKARQRRWWFSRETAIRQLSSWRSHRGHQCGRPRTSCCGPQTAACKWDPAVEFRPINVFVHRFESHFQGGWRWGKL